MIIMRILRDYLANRYPDFPPASWKHTSPKRDYIFIERDARSQWTVYAARRSDSHFDEPSIRHVQCSSRESVIEVVQEILSECLKT